MSSSSAALSKRLLDEYASVRDSLPADIVSGERRQEALEALATRGLPSTRDENWRYTNLRPLERARFAPVAPAAPAAVSPGTATDATATSPTPASLAGFARYTFVDGVFAPELSSPAELAGLTVCSLRRTTQDSSDHSGSGSATVFRLPRALPALSSLPEARLALLNDAFATDTAAIHVAGAAAQTARVELVFIALASADTGSIYPRVQVSLDPAGRLVLVERHVSAGAATHFINSSVNVDVGRGAH